MEAIRKQAEAGNTAVVAQAIAPDAVKYIGESASYIARGGREEQGGSTLGKVLKTVATIAVPVVAAVAAPFLAPIAGAALGAIGLGGVGSALGLGALGAGTIAAPALGATALGSGLTGSLLGAGLGAGVGALTGQGALTGAITGGLGGGIGGAANIGSLVGLAPSAGTAGTAGAFGGLPSAITNSGSAAGLGAAGTAGTAGTAGLSTLGSAAATGLAPSLVQGAVSLITPLLSKQIESTAAKLTSGDKQGGLVDLALTMYNKPPEGLTEEERRAVEETSQLAATNRELFNKRVEQANVAWQTAQANPEQAYGEVATATERNLRERLRKTGGAGQSARRAYMERQAAISGAQAGSAAVTGETSRMTKDLASTAGLMPTSAPETAGRATLPLYQAADKRMQLWKEQQSRAIGSLYGGNMYGGGNSAKFGLSYAQ
jgi:hypothetical protein